jgi:hypothetical protein
MNSFKFLLVLVFLSMMLLSCSPNNDAPSPEEFLSYGEGFGTQDIWIFQRFTHISSDHEETDILHAIIENAILAADHVIELPGGATYQPISNLSVQIGKIVNNAPAFNNKAILDIGLLTIENEVGLIVIATHDRNDEQSHIALDNHVFFDIEGIPGVTALIDGDSIVTDYGFAQTFRVPGNVEESGKSTIDTLITRFESGRSHWLGTPTEDTDELEIAIVSGHVGQLYEGSWWSDVAKKFAPIGLDVVKSGLESLV